MVGHLFRGDGEGISGGDGKTEPDEKEDRHIHDITTVDRKPEEDGSQEDKEEDKEESGYIEVHFLDGG